MKKILFVLTLGLALVLTSCGDQHKAQSLVKDFLNENLENEDCSFKRFSQLTPKAMIDKQSKIYASGDEPVAIYEKEYRL